LAASFHPEPAWRLLNEKRPQLLEGKTGAAIPMRQVDTTMIGASTTILVASPFLKG
jgi:hypothetical protein